MARMHQIRPIARMMKLALACLVSCGAANAQDSARHTATLSELFPSEEARALSKTIPAGRPIHFRVRVPVNSTRSGLLVFVKPVDTGEMPEGWGPVLDRANLIWVAADGYGNDRPRAERVLAAMAAVALVERLQSVDESRVYIGGMSGGGRIASQVITRFPRRFDGALYIVGADFWTGEEQRYLPGIVANRYVFVTGVRDFNRREMKRVFARYQAAGAKHSLLLDLPGFGHEYPDAGGLATAIGFLDSR